MSRSAKTTRRLGARSAKTSTATKPVYTVSGDKIDRSYAVGGITAAELADVIATMLVDLQAAGIVSKQ